MAASGITISASRDEVVDFTFPFWEEPSAVLIRRSVGGLALFWIYKPLKALVWFLFFLTICLLAWVLPVYTKLQLKLSPNVTDKMVKYRHGFWYIFRCFVQQGAVDNPVTSVGRLVAGSWWIVLIILYGIYTGNLIAVLSVKKLTMPFNTLAEMVSQSDVTYGAEAGIIHLMLFKSATSGVYKEIWEGIQSHPDSIVPTGEAGLLKVKQDKYGLIGDKTFLEANSVDDCDLSLIGEEFFKVGFGIAVQEGWPYKKYFDIAILELLKAGFIDQWTRRHWPQDTCGIKLKFIQSKSITIESISGNFLFLLCGVMVSTVALILELSGTNFHHFIKHKYRKS